MSEATQDTVFRYGTLATLLTAATVSVAYVGQALIASADPSSLALIAIGIASLVATRRHVR